jgi:hypothetical protein
MHGFVRNMKNTFCDKVRRKKTIPWTVIPRLSTLGSRTDNRALRKDNDRGFTGAIPTTSSYNSSVVKIYSATNSLARFWNKNNFSLT